MPQRTPRTVPGNGPVFVENLETRTLLSVASPFTSYASLFARASSAPASTQYLLSWFSQRRTRPTTGKSTAPVTTTPVTTTPVVTTPVTTTPVTTTPVTTAPVTTPVTTAPVTTPGGTTTNTTTTSTTTPAPPIAGNWTSVFDDEFNSTTPSPMWHTAEWWNTTTTVTPGGELETYAPSAVTESNGQLHLTATQDTTYGTPYVSGIASTSDKFSFEYGYMEVSAKIPKGAGLFPAIWMLPASHNDSDGEIDVMEALGSNTNTAYFTVHHLAINKYAQQSATGVDLSAGFHTFGVDWEPNSITWYLDGKVVAVCTDPTMIPHEPMYPIMDLAVGGSWAGNPNSATPFPSSMDIDYIRVWQNS